ncbi:MAG: pyridoxal phosphate-dependent aminotransferase [Deltaproteobacteria bacterium]|nr:pyridoxal phosphate-dependent aminotransferase [Deltaproteobacteria bacterium]
MKHPINSLRMDKVKPSATLAMSAKAKAMKAAGVDVCILSAGEPDFPTPQCIIDHAFDAANKGATRYTPSRGTPDLVEAMQEKLKRDQGVDYAGDEVIATVGTKGAISLALDALVGEGDEVIIIGPYWVTYPTLVELAGGTPVVVTTTADAGFKPSIEDVQAKISSRTRAIIINTPGNPTGVGLDKAFLTSLTGLLEGTDIWLLSDEIYERLTYDRFEHVSPAALSDDAKDRTLYLGGVAKAYAMTGWRLGVAAGPKQAISAMLLLQQQRLSCPTSISQAAAAYALREPPEVVSALLEMQNAFTDRRVKALAALREIKGLKVQAPEGSFYMFVDASAYLGGEVKDDLELTRRLLEEKHVALVPGTPFGAPGGFRLSFAASQETLDKGIERISSFFATLDK